MPPGPAAASVAKVPVDRGRSGPRLCDQALHRPESVVGHPGRIMAGHMTVFAHKPHQCPGPSASPVWDQIRKRALTKAICVAQPLPREPILVVTPP